MVSPFFRMSRSSVTRASSRFKRRFSASWSTPGIWRWFPEQMHPFVQRMRAHAQTTRNLPNWIPSNRNLMHRVPLELITVIACPHVSLLASKLGGKASTNLGAPQTPSAASRTISIFSSSESLFAWDMRKKASLFPATFIQGQPHHCSETRYCWQTQMAIPARHAEKRRETRVRSGRRLGSRAQTRRLSL